MIHCNIVIRLPIELLIVASFILFKKKMLFSTNGKQTLDLFVALHIEFVG